MNIVRRLIVLTLPLAIVGMLATAAAQTTGQKPGTEKPTPDKPKQQKMTFDLAGADCATCVDHISEAIRASGFNIQGEIKPASVGLARATVTGSEDTDLHATATKVNAVITDHREHAQPGLHFVLYARMDEKEAKKAVDAVSKMKGVDAKQTKADHKKGEISIKLTGESKSPQKDRPAKLGEGERNLQLAATKLTGSMFLKTLKEAGIEARYVSDTTRVSQVPR